MHVVMVSPSVNKQSLMPPLQFAFTTLFALSTFILKYFNIATIVNIVIADVAGYAFFRLSYIILYKKYFMDVYLKNTSRVN